MKNATVRPENTLVLTIRFTSTGVIEAQFIIIISERMNSTFKDPC